MLLNLDSLSILFLHLEGVVIGVQPSLIPPLKLETVRGRSNALQLGRVGREGPGCHSHWCTEWTHPNSIHSLYSDPVKYHTRYNYQYLPPLLSTTNLPLSKYVTSFILDLQEKK